MTTTATTATTKKIHGCTVEIVQLPAGGFRVTATHDSGCGPATSRRVRTQAEAEIAARRCAAIARFASGI